MGYTHYFKKKSQKVGLFEVDKAAKIAAHICNEPIFGQFVLDLPNDKEEYSGLTVEKDFVSVNGYCSKKVDLGHENLVFSIDNEGFDFCKTNRKPYDLTVVATMAAWQKMGLLKSTSSDSGIDNFARNYQEIIRYSVEECHRYYKSDKDCKQLGYKFPSVEEAIAAYERAMVVIENEFAVKLSAVNAEPTDMTVWF